VDLPKATSIGKGAFQNCGALESVDLPKATSIGEEAFWYCDALESVYLPAATSIDTGAFSETGSTELTITLGTAPPALGTALFSSVTSSKTVIVKVPSGASNYAASLPVTYSGSDTTSCWGNGFRGGGWNGSAMINSGNVNSSIRLTIEAISP
jgi:hypothetical protein